MGRFAASSASKRHARGGSEAPAPTRANPLPRSAGITGSRVKSTSPPREPFEGRLSIVRRFVSLVVSVLVLVLTSSQPVLAQEPTMLHPRLDVRTVVDGLVTPSSIAFLDRERSARAREEHRPGEARRRRRGSGHGARPGGQLRLGAWAAGHRPPPELPGGPGVYLYWRCRSTAALDADPFFPEETECSDDPGAISGLPDTDDLLEVPLLGNRVDRFEWTGSALAFDQNLIKLRAFQNDGAPSHQGRATRPAGAGQPRRRGDRASARTASCTSSSATSAGAARLQNLPCGPTATGCAPERPGRPVRRPGAGRRPPHAA